MNLMLSEVLDPNDAAANEMEQFYQESLDNTNRNFADEMSLREGFRAGWKSALRMVRIAAGVLH